MRYSPAGALVAVVSLSSSSVSSSSSASLRGPRAAPARPRPGGSAPLRSAVSTANGSWVVLPIGELGDPSNTFWQLLYAGPGSSHWSVVTPEGVADNGGIVAGVSPVSADVGVLPSGLLHFSPLARSTDGGRTWSPALLPGALAARPDALAGPAVVAGQALAVVGRSVLRAHGRPLLVVARDLGRRPRVRVARLRCDGPRRGGDGARRHAAGRH